MKNTKFCLTLLFLLCISTVTFAQSGYTWNIENTENNLGERVVAVIDAGYIGVYEGIGLVGEVVDDRSNWGDKLPWRSKFEVYVRFTFGVNYEIRQERITPNITLRLRQVSDSLYHLTALCNKAHRSVTVQFDKVVGPATLALGNSTVIDSTGTLVIDKPLYTNHFDGNVGIGVDAPSQKLEVNGTIRSKEVLVEAASWPDYVFEAGYDLPSLREIETFIKTNKHLPEIPSAREMEENGIQLGEMNILLLKKIEELTLHAIEQEKTNKNQQEWIDQLLKRIETLETNK